MYGAKQSIAVRAFPSMSILTMPCDGLVPAARTVVIAMRDELSNVAEENPDVVSVENVIELPDYAHAT